MGGGGKLEDGGRKRGREEGKGKVENLHFFEQT